MIECDNIKTRLLLKRKWFASIFKTISQTKKRSLKDSLNHVTLSDIVQTIWSPALVYFLHRTPAHATSKAEKKRKKQGQQKGGRKGKSSG